MIFLNCPRHGLEKSLLSLSRGVQKDKGSVSISSRNEGLWHIPQMLLRRRNTSLHPDPTPTSTTKDPASEPHPKPLKTGAGGEASPLLWPPVDSVSARPSPAARTPSTIAMRRHRGPLAGQRDEPRSAKMGKLGPKEGVRHPAQVRSKDLPRVVKAGRSGDALREGDHRARCPLQPIQASQSVRILPPGQEKWPREPGFSALTFQVCPGAATQLRAPTRPPFIHLAAPPMRGAAAGQSGRRRASRGRALRPAGLSMAPVTPPEDAL